MPFPRAPRKAVSGKLRLVVRSPETVVEVGAAEDSPPEKDYSDNLSFKVPKGFSLEVDALSLIAKQQAHALKSLRGIRSKLQACKNCRRKVTVTQVDLAERVLEEACAVFVSGATEAVTIVTGQKPNGVITFSYKLASRNLQFMVNTSFVEVGFYENGSLQSEFTSVYPAAQVTNAFSWLAAGK